MKTYIDLSTWNRNSHFRHYQDADFPHVTISCELDIAKLYKYVKQNGLSLYFSMIYAATKIADEIENLRYRFEDGKPFLIDRNTAFATHRIPGDDIFSIVKCDPYPTLDEFAIKNRVKADILQPQRGYHTAIGRLDILNFSCIPWIRYTQLERPAEKGDITCIPKISMGKYEQESNKVLIPFTVQTHHALMDGYHIGMFIQHLQEYIQDEGWK